MIAVEAVERRVEMSYRYGDWLVGTREGREKGRKEGRKEGRKGTLSIALSSRTRVFVFDWGDIPVPASRG